MFESVNSRTDALTGGRHHESHPISSPCEPSAYWRYYLMSFMKGDRLTLDLEHYFKIYLFSSSACAIISQSWLLSLRTNVLYRAVMAKRFAYRSYKPCPFWPLARAYISYLSCVYIALPFVRHAT